MIPLSVSPLLDVLRPLRWFGDKNASCSEFICSDWAVLATQHNQQCLWVLLQKRENDKRYAFLVYYNTITGEYGDATYGQELIDQLLATPTARLRTHKGAYLSFQRSIGLADITSISPLEKDVTTNTLFKLSTNERSWVAKFYRTPTLSNENEVRVLKLLSTQHETCSVAGTIEYRPDNDENSFTLAVISAFISGVPAYKLFSKSIKTLFSAISAKTDTLQSELFQLNDVRQVAFSIGAQTASFHRLINDHYAGNSRPCFNLLNYVLCNRQRWQRLYAVISNDADLGTEDKASLFSYLHQGFSTYLSDDFVRRHTHFLASISHGDLHLSHIFLDPNDVSRCWLIDPSPRCLNANDKEFNTQSATQDLKNLHRGLDYFSFDEITDDLARTTGVAQIDIAQLLWQKPQFVAKKHPIHDQLLNHWSDTVFDNVLMGYSTQSSQNVPLQHCLMPLFYFCRLLKEMEYNYTYDRLLFKYCDYFYLRKFIASTNQQDSSATDRSCELIP